MAMFLILVGSGLIVSTADNDVDDDNVGAGVGWVSTHLGSLAGYIYYALL